MLAFRTVTYCTENEETPSANDSRYGKVAFQPNALRVPVPGSAVTMPAAYRFAANAPRYAAAAIFLNPYVRAGIGIASWLGVAGFVWDAINQQWTVKDINSTQSTGKQYRVEEWGAVQSIPWRDTIQEACQDGLNRLIGLSGIPFVLLACPAGGQMRVQQPNGVGSITDVWIKEKGSSCPAGWYVTPAGCVQTPPMKTVTQPEFEDLLSPKPMPETVPWELPFPTPLPVEQPVINPEPGPSPAPRPRFVPTGDPVKNPNYDPQAEPSPENQPYFQPGVRIVPSPTIDNPWRIDVQPVDRPTESPDPQPEVDEGPGQENTSDKPKEETPGLCDLYPDILACAKLEMPEDPGKLPAKEVDFEMTPESGFSGAAVCPAPVQVHLNGKTYGFSWQPFCNSLDMIKPLLLAFAWLSAAFILLGARDS